MIQARGTDGIGKDILKGLGKAVASLSGESSRSSEVGRASPVPHELLLDVAASSSGVAKVPKKPRTARQSRAAQSPSIVRNQDSPGGQAPSLPLTAEERKAATAAKKRSRARERRKDPRLLARGAQASWKYKAKQRLIAKSEATGRTLSPDELDAIEAQAQKEAEEKYGDARAEAVRRAGLTEQERQLEDNASLREAMSQALGGGASRYSWLNHATSSSATRSPSVDPTQPSASSSSSQPSHDRAPTEPLPNAPDTRTDKQRMFESIFGPSPPASPSEARRRKMQELFGPDSP